MIQHSLSISVSPPSSLPSPPSSLPSLTSSLPSLSLGIGRVFSMAFRRGDEQAPAANCNNRAVNAGNRAI